MYCRTNVWKLTIKALAAMRPSYRQHYASCLFVCLYVCPSRAPNSKKMQRLSVDIFSCFFNVT